MGIDMINDRHFVGDGERIGKSPENHDKRN